MSDRLTSAPLVSVIVPVRDEGANVRALLDALDAQTIDRDLVEVIVADDGSTDGSTDGIEDPRGRVRVVAGPPGNAYTARNRALGAARGQVVAFTDADCRPEPDWLERGLAAMAGADIVAGEVRLECERPTVWSLLDVDTFLDQRRAVANGAAATANLFVWRAVLERAGGFRDTMPAFADHDLVRRTRAAGARLVYCPDAVVRHPTRDDARRFLGKLWDSHLWYGRAEGAAGRRPRRARLRALVPLAPVARSRRAAGRSLAPDALRLRELGIAPRTPTRLAAAAMIALVNPYLAAAAERRGFAEGRWAGVPR